ncbi:ABC transporter permease subunit [Bhargavaea ullalensis]|uniref:ABC-type transport system involved in multi-copper enzyme maturation permease subunit n=1 Tax=Bhargavaea ullalensis TaxID=1265685 RepID=A0ABV2GEM9_9BACL
MLRFEWKKIRRQRKLLVLLLAVLVGTGLLYILNTMSQEDWKEEAFDQTDVYRSDVAVEGEHLKQEQEDAGDGEVPPELSSRQEALSKLSQALYEWRDVIYYANWKEYPAAEQTFAREVRNYSEKGGFFNALSGENLELVEAKSAWLVTHGLAYEDERHPLTPHLFLSETVRIFFGLPGLVVLILLFGAIEISDREQGTWRLIRTEPVTRMSVVLSKFGVLLIVLVLYGVTVIGSGLLIPLVAGGGLPAWQYPVVLHGGESFAIESVLFWLVRGLMYFICGAVFLFALMLAAGTRFAKSFSGLAFVFFLGLAGYVLSGLFPSIKNPFRMLHWAELTDLIPNSGDWQLIAATLAATILLLALAVLLPENRTESKSASKPRFAGGESPKNSWRTGRMALFEWRKTVRQGLFGQSIVLFLLAVLGGYFLLYESARDHQAEYFERVKEYAQSDLEFADQLKSNSEEVIEIGKREMQEFGDQMMGVDEEQAEDMLQTARMAEVRSSVELDKISAYEERDWRRFHADQLYTVYAKYRMVIGDVYNSSNIGQGIWFGRFNEDVTFAEKEWMIRHDIKPVFSGEIAVSMYDSWGDWEKERKQWMEENQKVDAGGLFSLYHVFSSGLYLIPILLFVFLFGTGMAAERGKRRTMDLLLTQPVWSRSVFLGKAVNGIAASSVAMAGIFGILLILGTVFRGFGDWMYPILRYVPEKVSAREDYTGMLSGSKGFEFLPLGDYAVQGLVLSVLVLIFLIALALFISVFTRHSAVVFAAAAILSAAGYYAGRSIWPEAAAYIPFTYLKIGDILNGELAARLDVPEISFWTGTWVLSAGILFLLLAGYLTLRVGFRLRRG